MNDGFATEDDVLGAVDLGPTRDLVSGILIADYEHCRLIFGDHIAVDRIERGGEDRNCD